MATIGMAATNQVPTPRPFEQFVQWILFVVILPLLPFGLAWLAIEYLFRGGETGVSVLGHPDLVFVGFLASGTSFMDLNGAVEAFKASRWFSVTRAFLLLLFVWSLGVFTLALPFDRMGQLDRHWWLPVFVSTTALVLVFSTICEWFLFSYRERPRT